MARSSGIDPAIVKQLAHDIKSPLTAVHVLADLLLADVPDGLRDDVEQLVVAVDLAVLLTEDLGSVACAAAPAAGPTAPLGALVEAVLDRPAFQGISTSGSSRTSVRSGATRRALTSTLVNALRMGGVVEIEVDDATIRVRHPEVVLRSDQARALLDVQGVAALRDQGVRTSTVGLSSAHRLVVSMGGSLAITTADPLTVELRVG